MRDPPDDLQQHIHHLITSRARGLAAAARQWRTRAPLLGLAGACVCTRAATRAAPHASSLGLARGLLQGDGVKRHPGVCVLLDAARRGGRPAGGKRVYVTTGGGSDKWCRCLCSCGCASFGGRSTQWEPAGHNVVRAQRTACQQPAGRSPPAAACRPQPARRSPPAAGRVPWHTRERVRATRGRRWPPRRAHLMKPACVFFLQDASSWQGVWRWVWQGLRRVSHSRVCEGQRVWCKVDRVGERCVGAAGRAKAPTYNAAHPGAGAQRAVAARRACCECHMRRRGRCPPVRTQFVQMREAFRGGARLTGWRVTVGPVQVNVETDCRRARSSGLCVCLQAAG